MFINNIILSCIEEKSSRKLNCSNHLKYLFTILLLITSIISCKSENDHNNSEYMNSENIGIILKDRSTMRLEPFLYSSIITYIKQGEMLNVLDESKEKSWIGGTNDYWYKISLSGGLVGWTYGTNIKIFSGNDRDEAQEFLSDFWESLKRKFRKKISGRWWSIDKYGNYTNHCLEIYKNGTYKSYCIDCNPIEGDYSFNFRDYEIIFENDASFGNKVNYKLREKRYILTKASGKGEVRFKRVRRKIENPNTEIKSELNEE